VARLTGVIAGSLQPPADKGLFQFKSQEQHLVVKPEALKPSVEFGRVFSSKDCIVGGKGFHEGFPDAFH
jgi:hypothetical protein